MKDKDAKYLFKMDKTMKECAIYAMKQVDFHCIAPIDRNDFLTQEQYYSFIDRANDIGLNLHQNQTIKSKRNMRISQNKRELEL